MTGFSDRTVEKNEEGDTLQCSWVVDKHVALSVISLLLRRRGLVSQESRDHGLQSILGTAFA